MSRRQIFGDRLQETCRTEATIGVTMGPQLRVLDAVGDFAR